jgi:FdhD protein
LVFEIPIYYDNKIMSSSSEKTAITRQKKQIDESLGALSQTSKFVYQQGEKKLCLDSVLVEQPLQVRLLWQNNKNEPHARVFSITMRTPGQDKALIVGLLLSEGIVCCVEDIEYIRQELESDPSKKVKDSSLSDNLWEVSLAEGIKPKLSTLERYQITYSSCGLCGVTSLKSLELKNPPKLNGNEQWLAAEKIGLLPDLMATKQVLFKQTGGSHAAALFNEKGMLVDVCEDIGRHNALDKLFGKRLLLKNNVSKERLSKENLVVVVSGRISFEIIQKTVMAGIPVLIAVGAPSDLAIRAAKRFDLTLIAFASKKSFNLYHGEWRLAL